MSIQENNRDVVAVQAGIAGLAVVRFAGETAEISCRCAIVVLDGAQTSGGKTLVSAAGWCNVAHETVKPTHWLGDRHITNNELAAFPAQISYRGNYWLRRPNRLGQFLMGLGDGIPR